MPSYSALPLAVALAAVPFAAAIEPDAFQRYMGPKVCAQATGDPHVTTFDSVKYDCQAEGDVIMSKSLSSTFQLQGRYEKVPGKSVTTTQGLVLNTGVEGEPVVEISYTKTCDLTYFLDSVKTDLEASPDTSYDSFVFYGTGTDRFLLFSSGVELKVNLRSWMGDCLLNTYLCIPESLAKEEKIVGILGSPDNNKDNDFMGRDGSLFTPAPKSRHSRSAYCEAAWCVPSLEENLFMQPKTACGEMKMPKDVVYTDDFKCGDMQMDTKCPWQHGDRIFRLEQQTMESCRQACLDREDCGYYSYAPPGANQWEGTCMGCTAASAREYHKGFTFYSKECIGDEKPGELDNIVENADPEIVEKCQGNEGCIIDTVMAGGDVLEGLRTLEDELADPEAPSQEEIIAFPAPPKEDPKYIGDHDPEPSDVADRSAGDDGKKVKASGSGDPHFKTWTGEKFDYHGECDLVLVDNPSFYFGLGLRVHIRTTQVKYFSYIEKVAIQIGADVLEFDNDVENFYINGEHVGENQQHHKTMLSEFVVRRDKKALSIRLQDEGTQEAREAGRVAKIDLHTHKNGFPAVIVDAGRTDIFKGSLGLLGEFGTGRPLARDGKTVMEVDPINAEAFALEWQVRDTDPSLFVETRFPQFPQVCTPPKKMVQSRLGWEKAMQEAKDACAHWEEDAEDCIFDVMATRDVLVAEEGHIVHVE